MKEVSDVLYEGREVILACGQLSCPNSALPGRRLSDEVQSGCPLTKQS